MNERSGTRVRRGFADTPKGQIHYAGAGRGEPVLFLHQTPRSWDEFRDVLPFVGEKYRAIAMDTVGFGDSYKPEETGTVEGYAEGVIALLDALNLPTVSLVGHHTGGSVAVEVAATNPNRVKRLVISSAPFVDAAERERRGTTPRPIDEVEPKSDGSHLTELWQRRMGFYPPGRPDLLTRYVIDALKVLERAEEGHDAVARYVMEQKTARLMCPTLVMAGSEDPFALPFLEPLAAAIPGSRKLVLKGGYVPMVDQMPEQFARIVMDFLQTN